MKIYGYEQKSIDDDDLLELSEVTLQTHPANLRKIARFISFAADEMEKHGIDFGHEHLIHFLKEEDWQGPDIIISK